MIGRHSVQESSELVKCICPVLAGCSREVLKMDLLPGTAHREGGRKAFLHGEAAGRDVLGIKSSYWLLRMQPTAHSLERGGQD